jgi:hypothetical protein
MRLVVAIELIKAYQKKLGYDFEYESVEAQMEHIRNLALAQTVEVSEFLEWLPYKPWRKVEDQTFNVPEAALELVDQFFFMADMWLALGLSPEMFEQAFEHKLEENLDRIERGYNK